MQDNIMLKNKPASPPIFTQEGLQKMQDLLQDEEMFTQMVDHFTASGKTAPEGGFFGLLQTMGQKLQETASQMTMQDPVGNVLRGSNSPPALSLVPSPASSPTGENAIRNINNV